MRWLLENPQILFLLAGAIAYWLNERRKAKELKREMEEELHREPTEEEMAERTRQIQEEIRRKIEERQGDSPVARPARAEPARTAERSSQGAESPPPLPTSRTVLVSSSEAPGAAELERVMEEQRRYAEQLERLEAAQRARAAGIEAGAAPLSMAAYSMAAGRSEVSRRTDRRADSVLVGMRDREALRRAIVLREVLGAPKALR